MQNAGGAKEKGKTGWNSVHYKNRVHQMLMFFFWVGVYFFESHPIYGQTQGFSVVFLTL